MKTSNERGFLVDGLGLLISIKTLSRSLDFEVNQEHNAILSIGLKILVSFLKRVEENSPRNAGELTISSSPSAFEESNEEEESNSFQSVSSLSPLRDNIYDVSTLTAPIPIVTLRETRGINSTLSSSLSGTNEIQQQHSASSDDFIPMPLRVMERSVFRLLIAQQRQLLVDLYKILRNGIQILKHSRNARPKIRNLFTDVNMNKLFWRSSDKEMPKAGGTIRCSITFLPLMSFTLPNYRCMKTERLEMTRVKVKEERACVEEDQVSACLV